VPSTSAPTPTSTEAGAAVAGANANAPARRSQAQRSAATRDALLDATIACLVEDGYANTTTSRVAERAGVSRGAHLHHFQTRSVLVAAAMERLADRRGAALLAAAERLPAGRERLEQGLDLLWAGYAGPLYQAALDLWTHARTDAELRERLVPVERGLDRQTTQITRRLFPDLAERPDFDRMVEMAAATMRGLALLETLHPGSGRNRKQWAYSRARLVELFESLL
jgi:AcrR family transcriptional regulator